MSAISLLTAVQSNPNLPQSFRDQAIATANYAIKVGQEEIIKQTTATNTPEITPVNPVIPQTFGSVTQPPMEQNLSDLTFTQKFWKEETWNPEHPFMYYASFDVSVKDSSGNLIDKPDVTVSVTPEPTSKTQNFSRATLSDKYHASINLQFQNTGTYTIVFTSGSLYKSTEITF